MHALGKAFDGAHPGLRLHARTVRQISAAAVPSAHKGRRLAPGQFDLDVAARELKLFRPHDRYLGIERLLTGYLAGSEHAEIDVMYPRVGPVRSRSIIYEKRQRKHSRDQRDGRRRELFYEHRPASFFSLFSFFSILPLWSMTAGAACLICTRPGNPANAPSCLPTCEGRAGTRNRPKAPASAPAAQARRQGRR